MAKVWTTALAIGAAVGMATAAGIGTAPAQTLKLLTWDGYAPKEVIEQFKKDTGIDVEVTNSNNEEMISKLRATGGAGFDLAQPSQDRITGAHANFGIYKSLDLAQVKSELFIASMLEATKKNTSIDGKVYGLPHVWGTDGLVVNTKLAKNVNDYVDLCRADLAGRVSHRLKRPALIAFAFSMGMDPFAAYADQAKYTAMMESVATKLTECKKNVKTYWEGSDALLNLVRSGEVVAAMAWDFGGWKLNNELPEVNFVAPKSGALGWIDTFALPAKGRNDAGAYKWINFVMTPQIAGKITAAAGNFTASKGSDQFVAAQLRQQFSTSFPPAALDNIKWYPPVPAGLEDIEGKILERIKAARAG
ncbi:MAG: extracellular solute-binding protein [Pseudomonadota bacterium]